MKLSSGINYYILIGAIIVFSNFSGCKKNEKCDASTGGNVTLRLSPQHHGAPIYSTANYRDTAYIKFNEADFPGPSPSKYDLVVAGNANENFVNISNLTCGQYFIFMTGFDSSAAWNTRVVGGIPYNISESSGIVEIAVPVTE